MITDIDAEFEHNPEVSAHIFEQKIERELRLIELCTELRKWGLRMRSDSRICNAYIFGDKSLNLHNVVQVMKEMQWFFDNTDYENLFIDTKARMEPRLAEVRSELQKLNLRLRLDSHMCNAYICGDLSLSLCNVIGAEHQRIKHEVHQDTTRSQQLYSHHSDFINMVSAIAKQRSLLKLQN